MAAPIIIPTPYPMYGGGGDVTVGQFALVFFATVAFFYVVCTVVFWILDRDWRKHFPSDGKPRTLFEFVRDQCVYVRELLRNIY